MLRERELGEGGAELRRIAQLPTQVADQSSILGYPVRFPCPRTFASLYREIWKRGLYSLPRETESPRIVDCGANIGLASLFFKKEFPKAQVIAVEADPGIFNYLSENVASSGHDGIDLIHAAVTGSGSETSSTGAPA